MIIFLYGGDTFRSRRKLKEIKERFRSEVDKTGAAISRLDGSKAGLEDINEAVAPVSLFSSKRMVVIEDIFTNQNKDVLPALAQYLKELAQKKKFDGVIVFWEGSACGKQKTSKLFRFLTDKKSPKEKIFQFFDFLNNADTTQWIREECKQRNAHINVRAATLLASYFSGDLWRLDNEINKLISYKRGLNRELIAGSGQAVIEEADIVRLSRGVMDENIFALTDALAARNKSEALRLFERELDNGAAESYLMHMILRQFKILLQVKTALESGQNSRKIAKDLKLHPFVVQKCLNQVRFFTQAFIKSMINALLRADAAAKTGRLEMRTAVDLLLAKM